MKVKSSSNRFHKPDRLHKDEAKATLMEYSLLIGLVSALVAGGIINVGIWVTDEWTRLETAIRAASAG